MRRIFLFGTFKKLKENEKNLLTFLIECDKVNELLMQRRITKSHLKKFEKNLKKFLTNGNDSDKMNELSKDREP